MNDPLLHEFVFQKEAPLRERAARLAAQRAIALQGQPRPFGFALRLALGQALVTIGRAVQGQPGPPGSPGPQRSGVAGANIG